MMAKITKGSAFAGAVKYIFDSKKQTELLAAEGVRLKSVESVARNFEAQRQLNTRVTRPVGHISLDFSAQDRQRLDNATMVAIAQEYMQRMGIRNTQFIIGRHHDREHPHIHLLYNRVDNNGCTISDHHDRIRSTKICRELTEKHGLYVSSGKENVKRERLREPDATKYRIYDALVRHIPQSGSWSELQSRLRAEGIEIGFKTKGSTSQVEGVRFTMNNLSFNGSKVDRQFSYSKIDYALRQNAREEKQSLQPLQPVQPHHTEQHESSSSGNTIGSLFDLPAFSNGTDPEEEAFRRQMQRKKKKKGIRF
ncbi:relaxase/mobilization nuclease domain-containing protein [Bacteroides sp.]|uniref:relaxase/mobilization nuclease domain-containing protein n=1 Tax=Bacteroides sp. TaxID=29523 RepID=UPI0026185D1C|nr:relaxase/mobilization nuclease domain-containing protein [Bacteroides sp.]